LVLRNDLRGNPTLREVLSRARETALAAYAHQELPFDRVVDSVSPVRSLARNPLFQVVVHVRDHLPATRVIDPAPQGPGGQDTVCTTLDPPFDMAHPDQTLRDVGLIDAEDQHRILDAWSRGDQPPPGRPGTIPELLEPSRQWGPDRIAVRCGGDEIDYPSLHRRSDNLAVLLADRGVGPGSLVGLSTRRSIDLVVALVAIMKAGAAYFPIDPGYPSARKQFMLDDADPRVVVATAEAVDTMPHAPGVELLSLEDPDIRAAVENSGVLHPQTLPPPHPDDPMFL